jgi:hypothetical protein
MYIKIIIKIIIALSLLVLGGIFLFGDTTTSQICPNDTCPYDQSNEFTIPYSSQLNLNSSCDDIKDYIISELEKMDSQVFSLSRGDLSTLTITRKRELIFVLENSSSLIEDENGNLSSGIRFKFCCPIEQNCLL